MKAGQLANLSVDLGDRVLGTTPVCVRVRASDATGRIALDESRCTTYPASAPDAGLTARAGEDRAPSSSVSVDAATQSGALPADAGTQPSSSLADAGQPTAQPAEATGCSALAGARDNGLLSTLGLTLALALVGKRQRGKGRGRRL